MEDASAVSRDARNPPVRFDVAGAGDGVMEPLNGHEARNGGHSQGASCTPPRRSPTRLHSALYTSAILPGKTILTSACIFFARATCVFYCAQVEAALACTAGSHRRDARTRLMSIPSSSMLNSCTSNATHAASLVTC